MEASRAQAKAYLFMGALCRCHGQDARTRCTYVEMVTAEDAAISEARLSSERHKSLASARKRATSWTTPTPQITPSNDGDGHQTATAQKQALIARCFC